MLGKKTNDPISETLGHRTTGVSHFFLGNYLKAREYLESGISCYQALVSSRGDPSQIPYTDEMVFLWAWLPHILFALGYPDQAVESSHQALNRVQPDSHVHVKAKMLTVAGATFHTMTRDPKAVIRYADKVKALADEYHLPAFQGWAMFYRGWGRAALGKTAEGLPEMDAGRDHLQATGTQASIVHLLILQAEIYKNVGNIIRSAEILEEALSLAEQTNAHSSLAEIHRLHGELVMTEASEAEGWFRQAIEVAQAQKAKLWELRATVNLARLWQYQGRKTEAHQTLSDIYGWFTEGFDMPDLIKARSLLNTLAERS
jgi:predicted ATPase